MKSIYPSFLFCLLASFTSEHHQGALGARRSASVQAEKQANGGRSDRSWNSMVGTVVTTRKSYKVSPELQAVIGCTHCTRSDCLKKIWQYIREHQLQNAERKCIVNDAAMKAVFGTDEMKSVDIMVVCGRRWRVEIPSAPYGGRRRGGGGSGDEREDPGRVQIEVQFKSKIQSKVKAKVKWEWKWKWE